MFVLCLKEFEGSLKKFGNGELGPLQKQANTLMRDCDEADKAKLQALLQGELCQLLVFSISVNLCAGVQAPIHNWTYNVYFTSLWN